MKKFKLLVLLLSLFSSSVAFSQSSGVATIKGYVVDRISQEPLVGATVLRDTVSGLGVITDTEGLFELKKMPMGKESILTISYMGYSDMQVSVIPNKSVYVIPEKIPLSISLKIKEVVIYGTSPIAEIKGDTVQYNAGAYKTNPDASASDLISKMPGFKQNEDGTVSKDGESVTKVLVDGRNFFRDDVATALNALPANVVESIQFLDDKSDDSKFTGYDDGERVKTINIVTKTKQKNAVMGDYYAGYGFGDQSDDNQYMASANTNIFTKKDIISIGFGANNINKSPIQQRGFYGGGSSSGLSEQLGLRFNYDRQIKGGSFSATYMFTDNDKNIESLKKSTNTSFESNSVSYDTTNTTNQSHRVFMHYEQQLSSTNKLIARPRFSYSSSTSVKRSIEENMYAEDKYMNTMADTRTASESGSYSVSPDLKWLHNFSKTQFLVVGAEATISNDNSTKYINSDITSYLESGEMDSVSNQEIKDLAQSKNVEFDVSFTQMVSKLSGVNIKYDVEYDWSDNDKKTYMWDDALGGYRDINDDLSNTFARNYLTNKVNLGYTYNKEGVHILNIGAGYKHSGLQNSMTYPTVLSPVDYTFGAFDARGSYKYKISKSKNLDMMFSHSSRLPSLTQLQDVLDVSNPLSVSIGNPDLGQALNSSFNLFYRSANVEKSSSFMAYIRANQTQNSFATNRVYLEEDRIINGVLVQKGAQLSTTVNLDGYWSFRSGANYSIPFKLISSSLNMGLNYNFARTPGIENDEQYFSYQNGVGFDLNLMSNITPELDFKISSSTDYTNVKSFLASGETTSSITNNFVQSVGVDLNWIFWKGFFVNVDYDYSYTHLSNVDDSSYNPNQNILNAAIGKKFMNDQLDVRVSGFDLLGQFRNISTSVNGSVIVDSFSNSLTRYVAFSVSYKFNTLQKGSDARSMQSGHKGPGGGPGGMMRFR